MSFLTDEVYWMTYSRLKIPKGTWTKSTYKLFFDCVGSNQGFESTNMLLPCRLPTPLSKVITHMSMFCAPRANKSQYAQFISNVGVMLQIGNKVYFKSPGACFHRTCSIGQLTKIVEEDKLGDGRLSPLSGIVEWPSEHRLCILPEQYFCCELVGNNSMLLKKDVDLFVGLWGILTRPIQ